METWIKDFLSWTVEVVKLFGYPGVLVMMTLESTFVPLPSELVMPQAGYLAAQGHMNFALAVLMAVIGGVLGSLINYGLAFWLGRPFFLRFGKYLLCPPHKFEKMEKYFATHGEISIFTGRLLLGVRHFISFPAGLARMHLWKFCFYTAFGAGLWAAILAAIGYFVGNNPALLHAYYRQATLLVGAGCVVLIGGYVYFHRRRRRAGTTPSEPVG